MINFMRVDHRLLHGQVALSWFGTTNANCILIPNDDVPNDAIRKATLKMARPTGAKLVIMSVEKAADQINAGAANKWDMLVVVESIHDAYRFISKLNNKPRKLNLGGTKKTDSTKSLSAAVNVTEQDEKELKRLSDLGVKVYIQQVPTSPLKVLFE